MESGGAAGGKAGLRGEITNRPRGRRALGEAFAHPATGPKISYPKKPEQIPPALLPTLGFRTILHFFPAPSPETPTLPSHTP
jgi:hypothetical protein